MNSKVIGRWTTCCGLSVSVLVLCALGGVVLGTATYTTQYADGFSYLSNDPKACVNCHVMREPYDGWQKASHHATATCNGCRSSAARRVAAEHTENNNHRAASYTGNDP